MGFELESSFECLAEGDLLTPRRTVLAMLLHLSRTDIERDALPAFLVESGIPPIALEQPDIPISLDQELALVAKLIERLRPPASVVRHAVEIGFDADIRLFGVLGLAAMHAGSALEALRVMFEHPELSWGHCQVRVGRKRESLCATFAMNGPIKHPSASKRQTMRQYLMTIDLASTVRMNAGVLGPEHMPVEVWLPYPRPDDHQAIQDRFGCRVRFDAPDARLLYALEMWDAPPLAANALAFKAYKKQASQLAKLLRVEVPLSERARRLMWLSTPPPDRDSVASMLAISARTLARRLAAEGTSYAELQQEVQLARAQEYLRSPQARVSEVAQCLGFSDATAFSRAFRNWSGQAPTAWRKQQGLS
ncbi:MAG: AraC family transcriptional regulator ligand-binding domain-containing protein [Myxococcota bacterium]